MRTSLRSITTIDLIISTEQQHSVQCQPLPYNGSDHVPILAEFDNIKISNQQSEIVPKTNWTIYTMIATILSSEFQHVDHMRDDQPFEWFEYFQDFLSALKSRSTTWHKVIRRRPTISEALRIMIKHKHYLQNRYRHSKTEEDRLSLRSWHKVMQREFKQHRTNSWNQFIDKIASPNPTTFWKTIKMLNKKRSVEFSAITNDAQIHRTPNEIMSCLSHHFESRFAPPEMDSTKAIDNEANELWDSLEKVQPEQIRLAFQKSDLLFTTKEVWQVIKSLKGKNSSGFDLISNKMIKNLSESYADILKDQYNFLFATAYWDPSWKQARTICFNKVDNPAPTSQQLRPIALLPVLGKIYERLFLLRFKKWLNDYGILPWQQSGARPNQCTLSRVNHLLEQTCTSLLSNTFTPIVFIDFLQAFDLLWQQGLLLKLQRLNCPSPYLLWLKNYFSDRTMKIDFNGQFSKQISIKRGAPQGSVLGAIAYIVAHHDLPTIFQSPQHNHLYVDDLASIFVPNIYKKFKDQVAEIEVRINEDLKKLHQYSTDWHQPVNVKKTEFVVFSRTVKTPKLNIVFDGSPIEQKKNFKYLGFRLDSKFSFNCVVDDQL